MADNFFIANQGRSMFDEDEPCTADYSFVKWLLGDLSREFVSCRLIVVPDMNGIKAEDIVQALDIIYSALARRCVERSK